MNNRLPAVPAAFFGMVLGLVGLGGAWRLASRLWGLPHGIGEAIMGIAVAVWAILLILFIAKWIWRRPDALVEFEHPVLCCFIGLVPVSTALIALAVLPYSRPLATALAAIGIVGQLGFAIYRSGRLWMGNRDHAATTPVLYLPTVAGSFVSAIVLGVLGHPDWATPFFGAGLLSWLSIESVLVHRLYLHELQPPLRPTLGIQLAPPTVGCVAYLSITSGPPDLVAQALFGYGVLQALLLIRLLPWILQQPFSAPYWAFTFGIAALAQAALRFAERGGGPIADAAPYIFAVATAIIGGIALGTIWLLLRGKLIPPAAPLAVVKPAAT